MSDLMSEEEIPSSLINVQVEIENTQNRPKSPLSDILPNNKRPTKRFCAEIDSDERTKERDDEGFTVVRRKNKQVDSIKNDVLNKNNYFDVCITSYEMLPKQIGLARLFKSEDITNASQIKYKNAYKAIISFEKREDALRVINNKKLLDLGYRCHLTTEVDLSYGIVKYLEIDMSDEELMKSFSSDYKIVSVKRLKRLDEKNEWINSETVRFGFKSSILPGYIYGFDYRFKVEPYTFPVSQCSSCWKFGHRARTCPSKTVCPKCGGGHNNCDITEFRCVNCKGQHISFSKVCPIFLKEKEIRCIMAKNNWTYKMALDTFLEKRVPLELELERQPELENRRPEYIIESQPVSSKATYSSVLQQEPFKHKVDDSENSSEIETEIGKSTPIGEKKKKPKKVKTQKKDASTEKSRHRFNKESLESSIENEVQEEEKKKNKFIDVLRKLKEIVISHDSFEEKVQKVIKIVLNEIVSLVVRNISNGEVFSKLTGLFHYG